MASQRSYRPQALDLLLLPNFPVRRRNPLTWKAGPTQSGVKGRGITAANAATAHSRAFALSCGFGVDRGYCDLAQRIVRLLFFGQRLIQQLHGLVHAELVSPGLQRAIARDFVMFDGLRRSEQSRIERWRILVFVHDLPALVENTLDRVAFPATSGLS